MYGTLLFLTFLYVDKWFLRFWLLPGSLKFLSVRKSICYISFRRSFGSFLVTCNQVACGFVISDDLIFLDSLQPEFVTF
jgi:hypothetical protein